MCQVCDHWAASLRVSPGFLHGLVTKTNDDPLTGPGLLRWEVRIDDALIEQAHPILIGRIERLNQAVRELMDGDIDLEQVRDRLRDIVIPEMLDKLGNDVVTNTTQAQIILQDLGRRVFERRMEQLSYSSSFDLEDEKAVNALIDYNNFWLRHHFNDATTQRAKEIVTREFARGAGRKEIASALMDSLGTSLGDRNYWTTVSAAWSVQSRTLGSLRSFEEVGIELYEFSNPNDERTSEICKALIGMTWEVPHAIRSFSEMMDMRDPEEIKRASPWLSVDGQGEPYFNRDGERQYLRDMTREEMGRANILWPPRHGRCRSTIEAVL